MKIHTNTVSRLVAQLDEADMKLYEIAFNSLDINDPATQNLISDLLCISKLKVDSRRTKLNIDVISSGKSEMFIILTPGRQPSVRVQRLRVNKRRLFCLLFSNEDLFYLCEALRPYDSMITDSRLYRSDNGYAVLIGQNRLDKINLRHILSEYGTVLNCSGRLSQAHIAEHFDLICSDFIKRLSP